MSQAITAEGISRDQWLAERSSGIGASESSCLFTHADGSPLHPYLSPYKLYCIKRGLVVDDPEVSEWVQLGLALQPGIIAHYERKMQRPVTQLDPHFLFRSRDLPFMVATPDGELRDVPGKDGPGTLEIKNVTEWKEYEWRSGPPLKFQVQVTHQMIVTGYRWGCIAALVGGNRLIPYDVDLNENFAATLTKRCGEFWQRVKNGEAPPVDSHPATGAVIKQLHPDDNGEVTTLPAELIEWDQRFIEAKAQIAKWEKIRDEAENNLRAAIGPNTFGTLPDGVRYSLKTTTRKGYTVQETKFRTLRRKDA